MIKVSKDLNIIPPSLIPSFEDLFPERVGKRLVPIPQKSRTTHDRRMDAINAGAYKDDESFNSRYKEEDIKQSLHEVYKGKCAFCEQNEEVIHVEHYRPKSIYYWLAYSWDNLLLSCPSCNGHKGTNFDLDGPLATFDNTEQNIRAINASSAGYDDSEIPQMVNPEVTDPKGQIYFEKDGRIRSDNPRFTYTIKKCKIDRKSLNDSRRSILDRFREYVRDSLIVNNTPHDQTTSLATNLRNFVSDAQNEHEEFLAFRYYAIESDWLNDIIKEVN